MRAFPRPRSGWELAMKAAEVNPRSCPFGLKKLTGEQRNDEEEEEEDDCCY